MSQAPGLEKFDELIDKSGLGGMLDHAASFLFGESVPSDGLRHTGNAASIAGFLPYRGYLGDQKIYENLNSLGWVIEIAPLTGSDEKVEAILEGLFEEGFPDNIHVQVSTYASPYVGELVERWAAPRVARGGVMERIGRKRAEHLRRMIWDSGSKAGPFYLRDYRVFLAVTMSKKNYEKTIDGLLTLRDSVINSLKTLGLPCLVLDASDLINLVSGWLAMGRETRNGRVEYDPQNFICDQIVKADSILEVYRDRLVEQATTFGVKSYMEGRLNRREPFRTRQEIRTFSVSRFPKTCSQSVMASLLGDFRQDQLRLAGSWWSTLKISYLSAEASKLQAQLRSQRAARQYKSPFKSMYPAMIEKANEWGSINGEVQDGARLIKFAYSIMIQSPEGAGEEAERAMRSLYRTRGFELERNDCCHLPVMLSCLPMGYGDNFNKDLEQMRFLRTGMTRNVPALAPLQGQPKCAQLPETLLISRMGQPLFFSPFQNEGQGNHNMCVTGASGSGKSVFMQSICVDGLANGHHAMVIDDGRSFETLCKILGGEHIVFRADEAISLNPFSMISQSAMDNDEELLTAMNMIVQVVLLMARGEERADRDVMGLIDSAVGQVFAEKQRNGSVTDVRKALMREGGPLTQSLARAMSPYCKGGTYEKFFSGPSTLSLENPFTVFEMADLESKPDLRSVAVLCLLFQISERMRVGGREQRKLVFIDEAWQMLGGGPAGKFIEGFVRRARKEGGALITGTQSINDYYANAGSRAAFDNSAWKIVLRISDEEADGLKRSERLSLDDASLAVLKTLKMSPGEYSELIVFGDGHRFVGRLVLDPYSAAVFSSSPAVYARIQREVAAGTSLPDVIEAIAYGDKR